VTRLILLNLQVVYLGPTLHSKGIVKRACEIENE